MSENETQMSTEEETKMEETNGDGTGGDAGSNGSAAAAADAEERKLFCGGLSLDTTEADLREHFATYGEIEQCTIKMNPVTNKSRCFGFITFATKDALEAAIAVSPHTVKGKQIDPKPAKARPGANKVFCGGLPPETSEEEIRAHFGQFGNIENLEMPMDKEKNVRRGFIFVTYETVAAAEAAAKKPKQIIGGKECDVKKATPRNSFTEGFRGGWNGFGARGGRGGARGGGGGRGGMGRGAYGGNQGWAGYGGGYGAYDAYGGGYAAYEGYGGGWGATQGYGVNQWQQTGGSYGKQQGRGAARNAGYHPYR